MNKKEYLKKLGETIKNKKPVKCYIDGDFLGIMEYNSQKQRYECDYGNIPIEKMSLILTEDESVNHLKLEVIE